MEPTAVNNFNELLETAKSLVPKTVAVVCPNNAATFSGIFEAGMVMRTNFILFGDKRTIAESLASAPEEVMERIKTIPCENVTDAISRSIAAVGSGEAQILLKGGVDTATMMKAVLSDGSGLKTGRLLSDIFVLEYPKRPENQLIMITDGGMTLSPDLKSKVDLIGNAVQVAHALGNTMPRVAVLSATEFVMPNLQSTIDAAALSKMNERGQIAGCIVDGPLALDNAVSAEAAEEKGIKSPVAGRADILVAANIEAANSLAKSTTYFADLRLAHIIVGGKDPILIPSRADKGDARLFSIALASLVLEHGNRLS